MFNHADKENYHEEIQATYIRWSDTGRRCDELKQDATAALFFKRSAGIREGSGKRNVTSPKQMPS